MTALGIALLVLGVGGAITRPRGLPAWSVPSVLAVVAVVAGVLHGPTHALRPLASPIAFLFAAVPLAVLLDRLGFFSSAAEVLGKGRHLALGLWVLGALVTTVLNLDASVVLLTPLYVRIAQRRGLDVVSLAFQPVLLSCLASSALPVSNLTNLIAASDHRLRTGSFVAHLALPSLAATIVGWFVYRRVLPPGEPTSGPPQQIEQPAAERPAGEQQVVDRRALVIGALVVAGVLVGFVIGSGVGVPEWAVALGADVVLVAIVRVVPWRDVPWGTGLVAASLGLLAAGAASHLDLVHVFSGGGNLDLVRVALVSAVGANLVNNLPALLVALPSTGQGIWALLLGVNIGPMVLVTGTLAALLWQSSLGRLTVHIDARTFARVGARVMLPSFAAAIIVLLVLRPLTG